MRTLVFLSILAAGTAAAQQPAPSEAEKKPRPLNLKLDDAPRAGPRVTFDIKDEKAATSNLPGLGEGARTVEQSARR